MPLLIKKLKPLPPVPKAPKEPVKKKGYHYNLYEHGITQSILNLWLQCREQAKLSILEGLAPDAKSAAFDFGSLIHNALDWVYSHCKKLPGPKEMEAALKFTDQEWRKEAVRPTADLLQRHEKDQGIARVMLRHYFKYWAGDFTGKMDWVSLEEKFRVPYKLHSTNQTFINGKFDGIFTASKKLWLFETKTKSRMDEDAVADSLGQDLQVKLYLLMLWRLKGEVPKGVKYNIIRKPQIYYRKEERLVDYCARLDVDVKKRMDWYFIRYEVPVTKKELEDFAAELDRMLQEFERWYMWIDRPEFSNHYKNSNHCIHKYGPCQFLPICARNDRTFFRQKKAVFPELEMEGAKKGVKK